MTVGRQAVVKAVIYAKVGEGRTAHETVHAYCRQTFGEVGPDWYAEGMAEMAQYWKAGDRGVHADPVVVKYLREAEPKTAAEIIALKAMNSTWQNYAWCWSLCHLLENNPNYSDRFRKLGLGLLKKRKVSFERSFRMKQLEFEYSLFLKHLDDGFRVDLCAWDWKKKFRTLSKPGETISLDVAAASGWQPTGLTMQPGVEYDYEATGTWTIEKDAQPLDADGGAKGRGRLVGVLKRDFELSRPFELGRQGTMKFRVEADLYLRCRDAWNELSDNEGEVSVTLRLKQTATP
jgi:hypothetical protein